MNIHAGNRYLSNTISSDMCPKRKNCLGDICRINSSLAGVYKNAVERGFDKVYGMLHAESRGCLTSSISTFLPRFIPSLTLSF